MVDSKVETLARLAQWRIESFGPTVPYRRSDPFKIGIWNWLVSTPLGLLLCFFTSWPAASSHHLLHLRRCMRNFIDIVFFKLSGIWLWRRVGPSTSGSSLNRHGFPRSSRRSPASSLVSPSLALIADPTSPPVCILFFTFWFLLVSVLIIGVPSA